MLTARGARGRFEGVHTSSRPPPGAGPSLPSTGEGHGFPGDRVPFLWADGVVLGLGNRPSSSVFKESATFLPQCALLGAHGECHKIACVSTVESLTSWWASGILYLIAVGGRGGDAPDPSAGAEKLPHLS